VTEAPEVSVASPEPEPVTEPAPEIVVEPEPDPVTEIVVEPAPMLTANVLEYIVQPGDYLAKIAKMFNTTWEVLQQLNDIANPNLIYPDQVIKLPTP
jgi:LysM repeat protein